MECIDSDHLSDELFTKKFSYCMPSDEAWSVDITTPSESTSNEDTLKLLKGLKESLNSVKSSLNNFDIVEWSSHTNFTNPAAKILLHLRKTIHPELATQAWCKFYELLSYGDVIPADCHMICSVHLCEAPGGFICALNHFLKTSKVKGISHSWVANTLNPYYEGNTLDSCIVDDRLISRTLRSWCFGHDNTGDIFEPGFIACLKKQCSVTFHSKDINLVTADGSLNCQNDPSEQETIVAPLHYTELLCALSILCPGGTFVIKLFTLFEKHSINLMYTLCCLFNKVSLLKLATSKAGNSEVYVVSRGFCGLEKCKAFVDNLRRNLPFVDFIKENTSLFPNIPSSFILQHFECAKYFMDHQVAAINRNIYFYHNKLDKMKQSMRHIQDIVTQKFFDLCELRKLPAKQCVVTSGVLRFNVKSNLKLRPRLEGSYAQRTSNEVEGTDVQMQVAENDEKDLWIAALQWMPRQQKPFWWNTTQAVVGKPVTDIHASLFCATDVVVNYESAFDQCVEMQLLCKQDETQKNKATVTNEVLVEELSCMLSCLNGDVLELFVEASRDVYRSWLQELVKSNNPTLSSSCANLCDMSDKKNSGKTNCAMTWCSLIKYDPVKWPELGIRNDLVRAIYCSAKSLQKDGICLLLLPTLLTRLSAQMLWVFSQCFLESALLPVKSDDSLANPCLMFIGKKFALNNGYIHSLLDICNIVKSQKHRELLEIFPITALLHTEGASPFMDALRQANEKCLMEKNTFLTQKRLQQ
ncbi:cap-specific mRNA (nucleoside-2'-O-)-methyltransferase 2-like isoform X1 [Clavelina lepadiformis]|uniref:cap-specific mRNA (nucleoside-2'-O-)-methyltransferase 2-like isoform X1 n=1 Tax=Clavelina lepadiformis TaxID=159417 RepID=UPI00404262CD